MRRSGAPAWVIALGLGTRSESSARHTSTKVVAWAIWTGMAACVFLAYIAVEAELGLSVGSIGRAVAVSVTVVLGTVASLAVLSRLGID
ncbi:MAG: hypothetical protein AAF962_23635 [Actinomycetota bacterium]